MKRSYFYLLLIVLLTVSCQKEDINVTAIEEKSLSSANFEKNISSALVNEDVFIYAAAAPTPTINGEIQLALSKALPYPISVQFKVKETSKLGNNLVSNYFTIPAGQRYLTCNIDEYIKYTVGTITSKVLVTKYDSVGSLSAFINQIEKYPNGKQLEPYLQIWHVESPSSDIRIMVNYSILKISYNLTDVNIPVTISYALKASGAVGLSELTSVSDASFYRPSTGGGTEPTDPIIPKDPPSLDI